MPSVIHTTLSQDPMQHRFLLHWDGEGKSEIRTLEVSSSHSGRSTSDMYCTWSFMLFTTSGECRSGRLRRVAYHA